MRQKEEQRWTETSRAAVAAENAAGIPGNHGGGATRRKSSPGSMKRGKTYEIGRLELEHELLLLEILKGGQWRISNRQHAWRPAKCDGGRGC